MFKSLTDIGESVGGLKLSGLQPKVVHRRSRNSYVAQSLVCILFKHIGICLNENKSKKELNLFTKSFIKGILNDRTLGGINDFIAKMDESEINSLLDEMQNEISKREVRERRLGQQSGERVCGTS